MTSKIQAIVFDKTYYDTKKARQWLKQHKHKAIKRVDITQNTLRYRLIDPAKFKRFRLKNITAGIQFVFGYITT